MSPKVILLSFVLMVTPVAFVLIQNSTNDSGETSATQGHVLYFTLPG